MERTRVVITGLGAVTSIGLDVPTYWQGLKEGKSGAAPITKFDVSAYPVRFACMVNNFDPEKYMDKREAHKLDPFSQYAMVAAMEAIKDSGLEPAKEAEDAGCILGTGIGGLWEIEDNFDIQRKNPKRVSPFFIPKEMANASAANIAIRFGLKGPNYVIASACASAAHAMAAAFQTIVCGYSKIVVTGGSESATTPLGLAGFCSLRALSTRNDDPTAASRPFDKDRDGFVMGDGAGVLVFEELSHAKARGAKIYAEVLGFGANDDAFHITAPCEDGSGAAACMAMALRMAGKSPAEIDYINAHGTSTPVNDPRETLAIKKVFEDRAYKIPISSTKSMVGHLLGASGAVELVATSLMITEGFIHPTINQHTPDPECDLDYVPNVGRTQEVTCAISNSFGFGGHNATICIGKYSG
jgi:3-oxoacyl-[acyl-carrier-protein] synthase II